MKKNSFGGACENNDACDLKSGLFCLLGKCSLQPVLKIALKLNLEKCLTNSECDSALGLSCQLGKCS